MDTDLTQRDMYDKLIGAAIDGNHANWASRLYLITSYAYYVQDGSIAEDGSYDALCKFLLKCWDEGWRPEQNKGYFTRDDLVSGTAYTIPADKYPGISRSCAEKFMMIHGLPVKSVPYNPDYENGYCVLKGRPYE